MRKLLLATSVILAGGIATSASAQSLSDEIGAGLIGLAGTFTDGNYSNLAVNSADLDGSVNIDADDLSSLSIEISAGAASVDIATGVGGISGAGTLSAAAGTISAGDVSTTVIGAVNDGSIASGASSLSGTQNNITASSASAAANTANTAAAEAASFNTDTSLSGELSGNISNVYSTNFAYNEGVLNGAVTMSAGSVSASSIATTVAGAVNTGTISAGIGN